MLRRNNVFRIRPLPIVRLAEAMIREHQQIWMRAVAFIKKMPQKRVSCWMKKMIQNHLREQSRMFILQIQVSEVQMVP